MISCLKLVRLMEEVCPEIDVQVVGETDVLVEWISVDRYKGWRQWSKAAFVCLISFFGTAFTIMAYHNDVGINEVFTGVYRMCMGAEPGGMNTGGRYHCVLQSYRRQAADEGSDTCGSVY